MDRGLALRRETIDDLSFKNCKAERFVRGLDLILDVVGDALSGDRCEEEAKSLALRTLEGEDVFFGLTRCSDLYIE